MTRYPDRRELTAAFNDLVRDASVVVCPGNIQSPGPWRRGTARDVVAGTLLCGIRQGRPLVAWTDDAQLLIWAAQVDPGPDALPPLYRWWSTHS